MAKVEIKTRGKRGGDFSQLKETAQAVVYVDSVNRISVDSYEGQGATYKERTKSEVHIEIGSVEWKGTIDELQKILSANNLKK